MMCIIYRGSKCLTEKMNLTYLSEDDMKNVEIKSLFVGTTCISYIFRKKSLLCKDILIPAVFSSSLVRYPAE